MNKISLLGAFIVVALSLLGVGYATWTDSVSITSTITTGKMEVGFIEDCCTGQFIWDNSHLQNYGLAIGEDVLYAESTVNAYDPDTANLIVENIYPGTEWYTIFTIKNTGTIPVVYDFTELEYHGNNNLTDILLENVTVFTFQDGGEMTPYNSVDSGSSIYNLDDMVDNTLGGLRLEPDEGVCIFVYHNFPENNSGIQDATVWYDITINFRQHNVLPSATAEYE